MSTKCQWSSDALFEDCEPTSLPPALQKVMHIVQIPSSCFKGVTHKKMMMTKTAKEATFYFHVEDEDEEEEEVIANLKNEGNSISFY